MTIKCERCDRDRHNVQDEDQKLCWACRRELRKEADDYKPRSGEYPNMERLGPTNAWTKMKPEAVAWLKLIGSQLREEGVQWQDIYAEMVDRYDIQVDVSNLINILAGRAWAWMDNPEEYADDDTLKQIKVRA